MARGKVQMRRIENPGKRQVTFCKRRTGILKKAKELSVLCDAEIGIVIFSTHGKLYELATNGAMHDLIERYRKSYGETQSVGDMSQSQETRQEVAMLKLETDLMQKGLRYMLGQAEAAHMTLEELHALQGYLETWMNYIHSTKVNTIFIPTASSTNNYIESQSNECTNDKQMQMMTEEIQSLKNKERVLKAANELLQEKIVEQTGDFDIAQVILQQDDFFTMTPSIVDVSYPLTIQNEIFQF